MRILHYGPRGRFLVVQVALLVLINMNIKPTYGLMMPLHKSVSPQLEEKLIFHQCLRPYLGFPKPYLVTYHP